METSGQPAALRGPEHQRAYKACILCRKRKARCDLGERDGPPCMRCRRELRECIFSSERAWTKKRQKLGNGDVATAGAATSRQIETSQDRSDEARRASSAQQQHKHTRLESDERPTIRDTISRSQDDSATATELATSSLGMQSERGPVQDLAQSVMRTVVSNGNDALSLLFQAATQQRPGTGSNDSSRQVTFDQRMDANAITPRSTLFGGAAPEPVAITPAAPDVYKLWKSSRFVKMGWLSAAEAITYLDL